MLNLIDKFHHTSISIYFNIPETFPMSYTITEFQVASCRHSSSERWM